MKHQLIAMAIAFAILSGCRDAANRDLLTIETINGQQINNIGIASMPTPDGWMGNRSGGNTAVIFTRIGADQQSPDEMISIDIGTPMANGVEATANSVAAKFRGTVSKLPYAIDGEEAYRVTVPPKYDQIFPREIIVVQHKHMACFLFGGSKFQSDIWPALTEVGESWQWN